MASTLAESQEYEVIVEDRDGRTFTGRITGKLIAESGRDVCVYLTDDQRVLVHDGWKSKY